MKKNLTVLLIGVALWRFSLFLGGIVAGNFFPYDPTFPYAYYLLPLYKVPQWVYSWANFDGVHYLTIIERGYLGTGLIQAFFPGYPALVGVLNYFAHNALLTGLFVSNLFLFFTAWVWINLLTHERLPKWLGLMLLLTFPTAFYLGALYSESLFLFLVLSSFLAARKQYWVLASVVAGFASATRIVGIFLVPALMLEYLIQLLEVQKLPFSLRTLTTDALRLIKKLTLRDYQQLVGILIVGSSGLLCYMIYLSQEFSDPLYFFHVQAEFGAGRSESLIMYPQVVWRYIKILVTYQAWDWSYYTYIQEFMFGIFGFLGLIAAFKYVRTPYVLFSLAAFMLPTLTGTFSSLPRYTLVSFALFLLLAKGLHSHRWLLAAYLVISGIVLIINTMLFIQGHWIA